MQMMIMSWRHSNNFLRQIKRNLSKNFLTSFIKMLCLKSCLTRVKKLID
ncbi:hypothetical protein NC651_030804 [Populus alba x Populus x berolinensis]|nr:hypothetical protein NC651_030804 [Populus alba x Populus x berolinensis]